MTTAKSSDLDEALHALIARLYEIPHGYVTWDAWLAALAAGIGAERAWVVDAEQFSLPGRTVCEPIDEPRLLAVTDRTGRAMRLDSLRPLIPHVRRVMAIEQELVDERDRLVALTEGLTSAIGVGVLILDHGRVLLANERAHAIMQETRALSVVGGELHSGYASQAGVLGAALSAARAQQRARPLVLGRPDRQVFLLCRPLERLASSDGSGARGDLAVLCACARDLGHLHADYLRAKYALTPKEARLAAGLAEGRDLDELAGIFQVSRNTLRAQLRSVLRKTGTHRQASLVSLLLRDVPLLFAAPD